MMKRYEIQVLLRAGHAHAEVTQLAAVSERTARAVQQEAEVTLVDDALERHRRAIGRPSKAEPFRALVTRLLADEPEMMLLEALGRARLAGYTGGKTALYELVAAVRLAEERPRLRLLQVVPADLALRFPVYVGPPATVLHDTHLYSMSPVAAVSGVRAKRHPKRGRLLELGPAALEYIALEDLYALDKEQHLRVDTQRGGFFLLRVPTRSPLPLLLYGHPRLLPGGEASFDVYQGCPAGRRMPSVSPRAPGPPCGSFPTGTDPGGPTRRGPPSTAEFGERLSEPSNMMLERVVRRRRGGLEADHLLERAHCTR